MRLPDLAEEVARRKNDTSVRELSEEEIKQVYMDLWHVHIPKLVEADVVEYNQEQDAVTLAETADTVLDFLPPDAADESDDYV